MRILVTGAAGTVGLETLKKLVEILPAAQIIAFDLPTKKNKKRLKPLKDKVQTTWGDLRKFHILDQITRNLNYVIHLAAIIPPLADKNPKLAYQVNVKGTEKLLKALKRNSPGAMIIYSSSVAVYGDRIKNPWIRVTDRLNPGFADYYALTKIEAENLIRKSGLKWTIFRVSAVFGIKNHKLGAIMFHMPLETPIEFITPTDAGRAFAKAVLYPGQLQNRIFNLGGGENCRIIYKDFLQKNFEIYGLGKLNYPSQAFARANFHCGYYADGQELEDILHFRQDTIDSYFNQLEQHIPSTQKFFTMLLSPIIKHILLLKSEPLRAYRHGKTDQIARFFGPQHHKISR